MIKINDKEYDEKDLSDQAKIAFLNLQSLQAESSNLNLKIANNQILIKHWSEILEKELSKKDD
jgi:hypothetical protein